MDIYIRKASKADMPRVLQLITELAVYEKEPDGVKIKVDILEKEGFGTNPLFTCFVAEVNGVVEGTAIVYDVFSTWRGRVVHLEDLIVTQSMRGKGLGLKLYSKVMQYAHERGIVAVKWIVLDWNKPAIDFYEKSGATFYKDWYIAIMEEEGLAQFIDKG